MPFVFQTSLREDQNEALYEYDPYIASQVGQAISMAVDGNAEEYHLGSNNDYSGHSSSNKDDESRDWTNEKSNDEGLEIVGDYDVFAYHGEGDEDAKDYDENEDGEEYIED